MSNRILIVDDQRPILVAMKEYFGINGYEVDCASDFEEAEALLADVYYDVVIADLRLTGINGVEGLELVAGVRERNPRTRIIILTAYGSLEIEKEALWRGVDAFLCKPIPLSQLAQMVLMLNQGR